MICWVNNSQIDRNKWDECIAQSPNSIIYAYSWYLDRVCDEWGALIDGDYESVFPLPFRKKGGIEYVFQPPFCQHLGLFSRKLAEAELLQAFLEAIPPQFKLVELNLSKHNKPIGRNTRPMRNYELDLLPGYDFLVEQYSENHRRNISKARAAGLFFQTEIKPELIIEMFRQQKEKYYSEDDYKVLHRLMYEMMYSGKGETACVLNSQNEILAGLFLLVYENRIVFLFSGRQSGKEERGYMHFLLDECIRRYAGQARIFDFEGSNQEGLARFYAGFGALETEYTHLQINRLSRMQKGMLKLFKAIRSGI